MKNFIISLLSLTCAAVAMPLAAQGIDEVAKTDSDTTVNAVSMYQNVSEVVTSNTDNSENSDVEEDNNNELLIIIIILSLLSLIVSVISIIQNKKTMTEKDVDVSKDVERQLSNMQQQLLQMQKLMEEMLAKQSSLLGEFVAKLGTVQQITTEQPVQKSRQQNLSQQQTEVQQKRVKTIPQERIIYVKPSIEGANIVLIPVSEAYADRATFIIKALGNKGTYGFNKAATKSVISYLDNMLTPYCDCSLLTNGTVSVVNPTGDGTVEKQGDKWLVINKAQVSIS